MEKPHKYTGECSNPSSDQPKTRKIDFAVGYHRKSSETIKPTSGQEENSLKKSTESPKSKEDQDEQVKERIIKAYPALQKMGVCDFLGKKSEQSQINEYQEKLQELYDTWKKRPDLSLEEQLKTLQEHSETLQEHSGVRKELYRTDRVLTDPNLSLENRQHLQEQSKILQKRCEVLQELYDTQYPLTSPNLPREERECLQRQSETLKKRSNTLKKLYEVKSSPQEDLQRNHNHLQMYWEVQQTLHKIDETLKEIDQNEMFKEICQQVDYSKSKKVKNKHNEILHNCFRLISKYPLEEIKRDKKMLNCSNSIEELYGADNKSITQDRQLPNASLDTHREYCTGLIKYSTLCQKDVYFAKKFYCDYKDLDRSDILTEKNTGLEVLSEFLDKYRQVVSALSDTNSHLTHSSDTSSVRYKVLSTFYEYLQIDYHELQESYDNQKELKRSDLQPERREYLEIQDSISKEALEIGEKVELNLQRLVKETAEWRAFPPNGRSIVGSIVSVFGVHLGNHEFAFGPHGEAYYNIAKFHLDYLKNLRQHKSEISRSFSENPQNIQSIVELHTAWKEASQEVKEYLNAVDKFGKIPDEIDNERKNLIPYYIPQHNTFKWVCKVREREMKNLQDLAANCVSDNDGHLNKVKNCRMRLNTFLENYLADLVNQPTITTR